MMIMRRLNYRYFFFCENLVYFFASLANIVTRENLIMGLFAVRVSSTCWFSDENESMIFHYAIMHLAGLLVHFFLNRLRDF